MRGRAVRRAERAGGGTVATELTRCGGTWLSAEPDAVELERIAQASKAVREQRALALEFYNDESSANAYCIELFRGASFAPLHFADRLVEKMIDRSGEPPVVEEGEEQIFSDYLRQAVLAVALPDVRRFLAAQLRRMLPTAVAEARWRDAVAIDYSAFRTSLGNEVTPFLAQMALAGLAAYYDSQGDDEESQEAS